MSKEQEHNNLDGVAIIAMAGRFPGAEHVDSFWQNLVAGKESISFFKGGELSPLVSELERKDPHYVSARGVLADIDLFDAEFFNISPIEAQVMDPQQRLFLELCWEALESAGYTAAKFQGLIGVYGGMNNNSYYLNNVLTRPDVLRKIGSFQAMLANEKDFLTTRVSYKLNLTGPSENIYTACSTSLVAIIKAFQALMTYQCDMALAGGVSVTVPQNSGYLYQEGGMLSPDGHCRPFDKDSQGTTFNNGAGLVVLKRYEEALEDHDHIIAVIRGTGLNNDGGGKVSFTAPSVTGQRDAIRMALDQADILPETISYVETHGTGTPLGDPIEVSALSQAFDIASEKGKTCFLGSIKSNVGHMVHAAGVAGFIKTAMSLHNKIIPPTIFYKSPNPQINWERTPFSVCAELTEWPIGKTSRRAGVSSFGVGGTNAHVILEEFISTDPHISSIRPFHLIPLTARTENALKQQKENLATHLRDNDVPLADVAFTLQNGRNHFNYRTFGIFEDTAKAALTFSASNSSEVYSTNVVQRNPDIVFMFPGQGSQHLQMARGLYKNDSRFHDIVDFGADRLCSESDLDIRELIFSDDPAAAETLKETQYAQSALFLIEYALARLWQEIGVQPAAMIGHSIGEFTAACLAGVFSFEDGLLLVAKRGLLMQQCPSGSMLSIRLPAAEVQKKLPRDLVISTINAPYLCVVGGAEDKISHLYNELKTEAIPCQILQTSHAFHSPAMEQAAGKFMHIVEQVTLSPPLIPFISCVSGKWITDDEAISPAYWGEQIRSTVQFSKGISLALEEKERVFLEVGPRTTMATLARQHLAGEKISINSTLDKEASADKDYFSFLSACGKLWLSGIELQWQELYFDEQRSRVPLPTYPFEKKRFWLDPDADQFPSHDLLNVLPQHVKQNNGDSVASSDSQNKALKQEIIVKLIDNILESTGIEIDIIDIESSFLELGFDSLVLTQMSTILSNEFDTDISFRQMMEELNSVVFLADFLLENSPGIEKIMPEDIPCAASATISVDATPVSMNTSLQFQGHSAEGLQAILTQQLQILNRQLDIFTGAGNTPILSQKDKPIETPIITEKVQGGEPLDTKKLSPVSECRKDGKGSTRQKAFGPGAKISTQAGESLSSQQEKYLQELILRYTERTKLSKAYTAKNRKQLADPRAVSGFRPLFKEMIYPIVVQKSNGTALVDVDGNEYVDMLNGYGSNFLGFNNKMVLDAVREQMEKGIEIGPQHPLAAKVAELMRDMTGLDRFAFCNTGSEAVLGTMRIARTVTGRKTIVIFAGAYHGIFDEVIVRGTPSLKTFPAAPGIMPEAVGNTLILDYDSPEALKIIKERGKDIAAVLVEPVQSRNPALQPKDFLHKVRKITKESGTALIFDEVITGFRIDPGGAQAYFGVHADLATYGKVIGGGLPIGIIGGIPRFMDALDGGSWQYGDNSYPTVGVTYFAGTFVRHPMALAATKAVLSYLKEQGKGLQKSINYRADIFTRTLNDLFLESGAPMVINNFGSLMKINFTSENPLNELLYFYMREKGVHIWDGRPVFLTTAHTDNDLDFVITTFKENIQEMQKAGFFQATACDDTEEIEESNTPPVPGARMGKKLDGTPAWFIQDPERAGKYIQLEEE